MSDPLAPAKLAVGLSKEVDRLKKENERLRALIDGRDNFLVEKGLFGEFVELLKAQREQNTNPT